MKSIFTSIVLLMISLTLVNAQAPECGTTPNEAHLRLMESHRESFAAFERSRQQQGRSGSSIIWVPMQLHDLRSVSYNGMAEVTKGQILNELNSLFLPYQIQFYECGLMNIVVDPNIANFDISQRSQLLPYLTPNVINVFFVDDLTDGAASYCGWGDLPDQNAADDLVLVRKGAACMLDFDVFHHEIGHFLNLYHTHHAYNGIGELVDGSNCSMAGDLVCDTPADPNLYGLSLPGCQYAGSAQDANQQIYQPDPTNLMSYANATCRNTFTPGQMSRMQYCIQYIRNLSGCSHPYACDNPINSFPYSEDFESGLGDWVPLASNDYPVKSMITAGGPIVPNVSAPPAAQSGLFFAQPETAGYGTPGYYGLFSPCIDLSATVSPELSLWYYVEGDAQTLLYIQYSTDGGQTIQNFNPVVNTTETTQPGWKQFTVDLTPYINEPFFMIRIVGSMNTTFPGIDNILIRDTAAPLCQLTTTHYQSDLFCTGDNSGIIAVDITSSYALPVDFQWSNGGTDPAIHGLAAGTYTVTITDDNGCTAIETYTITEPAPLVLGTTTEDATAGNNDGKASVTASGGTGNYQYTWSHGPTTAVVSGLAPGTYGVTVTDANNCTATATVNIDTQVNCAATLNNFPYSNDLEGGLGIFDQESSLDDTNWRRRSGSTPSQNTGPSAAHSGSYYRYIEASRNRNSPGKVAILKTDRCLDLTVLNQPVFELYYHLYGNQMGSLEIQVSLDNGASWRTAHIESGNQGDQWFKLTVDLLPWKTAYTQLRIVGTTGSGGRSDMAIDDYYIGEAGANSADLVPLSVSKAPEVTENRLHIYPNPAKDRLYLQLPEALLLEAEVQLTLFDLSGRKLIDRRLPVAELMTLELGDQAAGYYLLQLSNSTVVKRTKLVIATDR